MTTSTTIKKSARSPLSGKHLMERLDTLAKFTEVPGQVTRTYLTRPLREAGEQLIAWMRNAGMDAHFDALGNVVGRLAGRNAKAPAVLLGSHYDTVRNAGKFDGPYGVIAAIAAAADLAERNVALPFPLEIIAFGDEEGVQFKSTLIGSRAIAGTLDPAVLDLKDTGGISLRQALTAFGGDPRAVKKLARKPGSARAYLELHIEQGPILTEKKCAVGVVTAIAGASRWRLLFTGEAGHAGTVPMGLRRDAAMAAAEFALAVEELAAKTADLVATVGIFETPGGAANVIPGAAEVSLDIRSPSDAVRNGAAKSLMKTLGSISKRRRIDVAVTPTHAADAVACDPALRKLFAQSIAAQGMPMLELASGAGHDAMAMADLCPVAMLFVRCGNGGISHDPRETMTASDAEMGARVLVGAIERLAAL